MLKATETLQKDAEALFQSAKAINVDAQSAVEDLKDFKAWAEKTRDSVAERGKALGEAIAQDHAQMESEFASLMDKADALIKKLEGVEAPAVQG